MFRVDLGSAQNDRYILLLLKEGKKERKNERMKKYKNERKKSLLRMIIILL